MIDSKNLFYKWGRWSGENDRKGKQPTINMGMAMRDQKDRTVKKRQMWL